MKHFLTGHLAVGDPGIYLIEGSMSTESESDATGKSTAPADNSVAAIIALSPWEIDAFFPSNQLEFLKSILPNAAWIDPTDLAVNQWRDLLHTICPSVIVSGWKTATLPVDLQNLKYVCHLTGSVRAVVPRELLERGVKVSNWGTCAAFYVAEHALLLILASLRSLPGWDRAMQSRFSPEDAAALSVRSLHGLRVGIHGFGLIARELIKLLKPFNVNISAYSQGVPNSLMLEHGVEPVESLEALASKVKVFVSCEALTLRSGGSINRAVLSLLGHGSVFVNVGRGPIVDETALAELAKERGLRIASDVFAQEPLPMDSPLRDVPNSIYSPHIGGPTPDRYPQCGAVVLENLKRFRQGQPLLHEVTLEIFDRST